MLKKRTNDRHRRRGLQHLDTTPTFYDDACRVGDFAAFYAVGIFTKAFSCVARSAVLRSFNRAEAHDSRSFRYFTIDRYGTI